MNRQIKFRGKRKDNGEWEFGDLAQVTVNSSRAWRRKVKVMVNHHEVIPDTVGQFTGLYDATKWEDLSEEERNRWTIDGNMPSEWKGREIYEGDILEYAHRETGDLNVITYKDGSFALTDGNGGRFFPYNSEVISNIHDIKLEDIK
jgi:hypothetical protein